MDENGLPITGAGVNYASVEAINQRELITYFNMFLVRTCTFLNNFSTKCEVKLADLNSRLASIDASITILETKLNSVDELKDMKLEESTINASQPAEKTANETVQNQQQVPQASQVQTEQQPNKNIPEPPPPPPPAEEQIPVITVSQDPRYSNYFKMLKFGIAEEAIKLKMKSEGIDPNILNDPNAPAPPQEPAEDSSEEF